MVYLMLVRSENQCKGIPQPGFFCLGLSAGLVSKAHLVVLQRKLRLSSSVSPHSHHNPIHLLFLAHHSLKFSSNSQVSSMKRRAGQMLLSIT